MASVRPSDDSDSIKQAPSHHHTTKPPLVVYRGLPIDTVRFELNAVWSHIVTGVNLPIELIFKHVEMDTLLKKHWLECNSPGMGGLVFPGSYLDVESRIPKICIEKNGPANAQAASLLANVTVHLFRREIDESQELQPFDSALWEPDAYSRWQSIYTLLSFDMDDIMGERGAGELLRRVMHTHFVDFGIVFSREIWMEFGLGNMFGEDVDHWMNVMLITLLMAYTDKKDEGRPPVLPPLYSPVAQSDGCRICAQCLTFRVGHGRMMRCPCHRVYYCSKECQRTDWKVHRLVCDAKKKGR